MVHLAQFGFVPGRRVTDNYIITQELIRYINQRKGKKNLMATKIDLDKAYDKLEWSFIKYTLFFLSISCTYYWLDNGLHIIYFSLYNLEWYC